MRDRIYHRYGDGVLLRQPPRSSLLHELNYNLFLLSGVLAIPGLMIPTACNRRSPEEIQPGTVQDEKEKIELVVQLNTDESYQGAIKHADIFAFEAGGLQRLLCHKRIHSDTGLLTLQDSVELLTVAIANSPYSFSTEAVDRYESLEQVVFKETDDSPQYPLMSGVAGYAAGRSCIEIELQALGCRILIAEVSNRIGGLSIVEKIRFGLTMRNPMAEIMRGSGFRPAEPALDTLWWDGPDAVGIIPVHPGTTLNCLPSDSDEETIGTPRTELVTDCTINDCGKRARLTGSAPLPPLRRGCIAMVEIEFGPDGKCSYAFF